MPDPTHRGLVAAGRYPAGRLPMTRCLCTILALTLTLAACAPTPPRPTSRTPYDGTRLPDIRPTVDTTISQPTPDPQLPTTRARVSVSRTLLPLDDPLDTAWLLVNEDVFPTLTAAVYANNGIRLGVLNRNRLDAFIAALPPSLNTSGSMLLASDHPLPLLRSPRLRQPLPVDLTIPPMIHRSLTLERGQAQILAKATTTPAGTTRLTLLPHHYLPKPSLLPRSPLEKDLDGRVITELTTRIALPPGHIIVLGLTPPTITTPKPAEGEAIRAAPPADSTVPATQPTTQPAPITYPARTPDDFRPSLGKSLFIQTLSGLPTQTLLLIRLEPTL
ncbi:MAG: hypothetical protein AAGI68_14660 [Planctomycetota bacterium]